jgi:hypothetical protein
MERHELGKFYATTFDGEVFEFIVFNDNTIDCPTLGINSIRRMELKPRFVLSGKDFSYKYDVKPKEKFKNPPELIKEFDIDDELFKYLKDNGMIRYSTDMAYFYGFSDTTGYDKGRYGVGSPYKWAKKKGPILVKQRNGQLN